MLEIEGEQLESEGETSAGLEKDMALAKEGREVARRGAEGQISPTCLKVFDTNVVDIAKLAEVSVELDSGRARRAVLQP